MDLRDRILDAALPNVVFDGWTQAALEHAATSIGLKPFDVKRAFPDGASEALDYFAERSDAQMLGLLAREHDLSKMKIRERIATCVMTRLAVLAPHREAVRRAVAASLLHAPSATKSLYRTADAMWRAAGDTATDYNHYTKRLILSQVYASTLLIWLDDTSADFADTRAFLARRIDNVMQFEKLKARAKENFGRLSDWLPFSATKASSAGQ